MMAVATSIHRETEPSERITHSTKGSVLARKKNVYFISTVNPGAQSSLISNSDTKLVDAGIAIQ
jgi:hypothetical protein